MLPLGSIAHASTCLASQCASACSTQMGLGSYKLETTWSDCAHLWTGQLIVTAPPLLWLGLVFWKQTSSCLHSPRLTCGILDKRDAQGA